MRSLNSHLQSGHRYSNHKTLQSGHRHSYHKTLQSDLDIAIIRRCNQDKAKRSQDIAIRLRHSNH